ncbi:hypothetical protein DMB66_29965 [Actinoplanes sp. ATCC 53533]|uniref:hypothetical protein n=1 Tax=Actinoplanes sp. ATCC 53533 TaxID=1288362 RepID=UPI000F77FA4E|nr:hypothetical protein [Actinoplanes sp. ATCC 53533]RSM58346.1 hypothetical protein DMB66_29965 [Actinoplanes sp. ATCC 53533]
MTVAAKRWMAGVLAVAAAYQGVWAAAFPLSFYNDFPGPGLHWVAALGPYNEHLARDTGALNLALLVLSVWALRRPTREAMMVTGGAWLIYNAIHFLWHMLHLDVFPTIDKIMVATTLAVLLLLSILLMLPLKETKTGPSVRLSEVAGQD